ncbi:MAG: C_GCAxxG_C_C family protein [Christensenellaceae bacterium]|nr:C_GCAxxG_C_C family protein [Christensenellaceae bacterium]
MDLKNSLYAQKALMLSNKGYNCAQSVLLAFTDLADIDRITAGKISSSFGGGLGMGDVCGVASAMAMVLGLLYGINIPENIEEKQAHYDRVKGLILKFKEKVGSHICSELLGIDGKCLFIPSEESEPLWNGRPCKFLIAYGAYLLEEYIKENPIFS